MMHLTMMLLGSVGSVLRSPVSLSRAAVSMAAPAAAATTTDLPRAPLPRNAAASWELHKFGGASLATPELYKQCGDLLISESSHDKEAIGSHVPTMAIVSARGGVTDRLIEVVQAAMTDIGKSAELLRAGDAPCT